MWRFAIFFSPHPIVNIIADQDSACAFCWRAGRGPAHGVQRPSQGRLVVVRAAHATMPVLWLCTFANQSQAVWLYLLCLCEFEMAVPKLCCLVGLVVVLGASGCVTLSRPVGFEGPFVQNRVLGPVFSQGSSFSIRCSCAQMESPWSKMYLCQGAAAR